MALAVVRASSLLRQLGHQLRHGDCVSSISWTGRPISALALAPSVFLLSGAALAAMAESLLAVLVLARITTGICAPLFLCL